MILFVVSVIAVIVVFVILVILAIKGIKAGVKAIKAIPPKIGIICMLFITLRQYMPLFIADKLVHMGEIDVSANAISLVGLDIIGIFILDFFLAGIVIRLLFFLINGINDSRWHILLNLPLFIGIEFLYRYTLTLDTALLNMPLHMLTYSIARGLQITILFTAIGNLMTGNARLPFSSKPFGLKAFRKQVSVTSNNQTGSSTVITTENTAVKVLNVIMWILYLASYVLLIYIFVKMVTNLSGIYYAMRGISLSELRF